VEPISLLIWLIFFVVIACVLVWIVDLFPNPPLTPTPRAVIKAAIVLICLLLFLQKVGLF
jgi:hypothetical protein